MWISGTCSQYAPATPLMADLHLVEGASHFTYFIDPFAPESQDIFAEMALFWDRHLGS
jgi:hypothetical protein